MNYSVIDFETRSACDIKKHGISRYAKHFTTDVLCMSLFRSDHKYPLLWVNENIELDTFNHTKLKYNRENIKYPVISFEAICQQTLSADWVIAQNSMFEYEIWNEIMVRYGAKPLPVEQLFDIKAQLAYHALPLNLEDAALALRLTQQKDMTGHKAMLKCCKPRNPRKKEKEENPNWENHIYWHDKVKDYEINFNYCCQDVIVEKMIFDNLGKLPEREMKIFRLDQKINLRGVPVDTESIEAIVNTIETYKISLEKEFKEIVGNEVNTPNSHVALRKWVENKVGYQLPSIDKNAVAELLEKGILPKDVEKVLAIRSEIGKSSVSKFSAMTDKVDTDSRVKHWSVYHGASPGRWAAYGMQLHNMPRDSFLPEEYEFVTDLFKQGDIDFIKLLYGDIFSTASKCVRGSICAGKGKQFFCVDFSAIEAIGLAYLAGEQWVLDTFAQGIGLYESSAAGVFNVPYEEVSKEQRTVGKVAVLALGYAGGIGAFASMAKNYNVDLETLPAIVLPTAMTAELDRDWGAKYLARMFLAKNPDSMSFDAAVACDVIKQRWRAAHPETIKFWKEIEKCIFAAIRNPGQVYSYRGIKYKKDSRFLKCLMPTRRVIHYYDAHIKEKTDEERSYITYQSMKVIEGTTQRKWSWVRAKRGTWTENIVQGFCRDLLADMMLRHEEAGFPIVLDVHDEDVAEVGKEANFEEFCRIAEIVPGYAVGLPIKAVGWEGRRYRKD